MKKILFTIGLMAALSLQGQNLYFPPLTGDTWEAVSPQTLGWCAEKTDPLYAFLGRTNTKAFIVLKDGKIVLERYFDKFTRDSVWYWASAGKTLTAMAVGIAQQEGLLKLTDPSSKYLGKGWTSATPAQEEKITVFHQLTMTSGLRDGAPDNDCTLPSCLVYLADPGKRWAYHNAPYTLLDSVVATASKLRFNAFINSRILAKTGMRGLFIKTGYNNVFVSNARSMARFGLLLLNKGRWNNTPVLSDTAYFRRMTNTSQLLNPSYGYLTWLNGKRSTMIPGSQVVFPRSLVPKAPAEMYAALGKNGQIINVVPSQGLVVVRMGNTPDNSFVPITYVDEMWEYLNAVICAQTTATHSSATPAADLNVFPNPVTDVLRIETDDRDRPYQLIDPLGRVVASGPVLPAFLPMQYLAPGLYCLKTADGFTAKLFKF